METNITNNKLRKGNLFAVYVTKADGTQYIITPDEQVINRPTGRWTDSPLKTRPKPKPVCPECNAPVFKAGNRCRACGNKNRRKPSR